MEKHHFCVPSRSTITHVSRAILPKWNERIIHNPDGGSLCQTKEYAELKRMSGWRAQFLRWDGISFVVLEKSVPFLGKFWYIPRGPGVTSEKELKAFVPEIRRFAASHGVFLVRVEPAFVEQSCQLPEPQAMPVQADASTVIVDLESSFDQVLQRCSPTCLRSMRRASRAGVTVKTVPINDENCDVMYSLLGESASGRVMLRPYRYYRKFWQLFSENSMGNLFFAEYDGRVVAACFIVKVGDVAIYKDAGSIRQKVVHGVSNLLVIEAMRWAHQHGARLFDLNGATKRSHADDASDPYYGITRFKLSFGGRHVDSVGCFDIVLDEKKYRLWVSKVERLIKKLVKVFARDYFY